MLFVLTLLPQTTLLKTAHFLYSKKLFLLNSFFKNLSDSGRLKFAKCQTFSSRVKQEATMGKFVAVKRVHNRKSSEADLYGYFSGKKASG